MKLKIGELAKLAGCPIVTIRFYEKEGVLLIPKRSPGNYRVYGDEDVERLRFVMHCRKHGIPLCEIKKLLQYKDNPKTDCSFVHTLIASHIKYLDEQIVSLNNLREKFIAMSKSSKCDNGEGCSILESLGAADDCPYCHELSEMESGK